MTYLCDLSRSVSLTLTLSCSRFLMVFLCLLLSIFSTVPQLEEVSSNVLYHLVSKAFAFFSMFRALWETHWSCFICHLALEPGECCDDMFSSISQFDICYPKCFCTLPFQTSLISHLNTISSLPSTYSPNVD